MCQPLGPNHEWRTNNLRRLPAHTFFSLDVELNTAQPAEQAHLGFIFKGENESTGVPNISIYQWSILVEEQYRVLLYEQMKPLWNLRKFEKSSRGVLNTLTCKRWIFSNPTPRNALFVRSSETFFTPSNANAHQSNMRVSHGLSARRAQRTKSSRPEGPQARSRAPEGPQARSRAPKGP